MYVELYASYSGKRFKISSLSKTSWNTYSMTINYVFTLYANGSQTYIRPFFQYKCDTPKLIEKRLLEESKGSVKKNNKYPLIVLFLPFTEGVDKEYGVISETTLNMAIIVDTAKIETTDNRLDYSFTQQLQPIYKLFMSRLKLSSLFMLNEWNLAPHDKTFRPFWSATPAAEQNTLSAIVDAIEINNLQLILNKQ